MLYGLYTAGMPVDGLWWYVEAFITDDSSTLLRAHGINGSEEDKQYVKRRESGHWNSGWVAAGGGLDSSDVMLKSTYDPAGTGISYAENAHKVDGFVLGSGLNQIPVNNNFLNSLNADMVQHIDFALSAPAYLDLDYIVLPACIV